MERFPFLQNWRDEKNDKSDQVSWVADFRRKGYERYRELGGLPSSNVESWKYTNLERMNFSSYEQESIDSIVEGDLLLSRPYPWPPTEGLLAIPGLHLVLVNGHYAPQLSSYALPEGLIVQSLEEALLHDESLQEKIVFPDKVHSMAALNVAWLGAGLVIRFKPHLRETTIVHIVFISTHKRENVSIVTHPCIIVIVEGQATLIESHIGFSAALTNMVSSLHVEPHARLTHVRVQSGIPDTHAICFGTAKVASGGLYQSFLLTTGLGLVRNELTVTLAGTEAECRLYGVYTADSNRHVDNTIVIDHVAQATMSRQIFKGVLDGGGRGVFQGRINIHSQAQKSDGRQLHKALLLSSGAEVNCKPELEIFADDVRCSHGATAGEMDDEMLFYLRARGLDDETVRALLIEAFFNDIFEEVSFFVPMLSQIARAMVAFWFADRVLKS